MADHALSVCVWSARFNMDHTFQAIPGAFGYQLSNPGVLQLATLMSSLEVFNKTSMAELREKSVALTRWC